MRTSGLQKTGRVRADGGFGCGSHAHVLLKTFKGQDTSHNACVVGEEERANAAQCHEV